MWSLPTLLWALNSACAVEPPPPSAGGCASSADCRQDRLCVDRVCLFPRDAAAYDRAEIDARLVYESLVARNGNLLTAAAPTYADLAWGFNLNSHADFEEEAEADAEEEEPATPGDDIISIWGNALRLDWLGLDAERVWRDTDWLRFEPGEYRPLPAGKDRARVDLDQLVGSAVVYRTPEGETKRLILARMLRLRGRWRLFAITEPGVAAAVDGDVDDTGEEQDSVHPE